ncbi:Flavin monooxygenase-like [Dillenia turbinata]|uniref:Flavin-containing monooxygenase n=1 Tax=Dillenia turbinata TaxID=194707 RepID=A0AAN8VTR6_9MAGN
MIISFTRSNYLYPWQSRSHTNNFSLIQNNLPSPFVCSEREIMEVVVVIVGAGPAGLATSACLNLHSIPNIVLEREDCSASLWRKHTYDRIKLHLGKQFCALPHMPFPPHAPTFVPKSGFLCYLDNYISEFDLNPFYNRKVESAFYSEDNQKWQVQAMNTTSNVLEHYVAQFLVVATGENSLGVIPRLPGLETFRGEYMHSSEYKNGKKYVNQDVLVVGVGNSGMEIAYDLSSTGANTSLSVRDKVHVLTKELVYLGMSLLQYLPCKIVDLIILILRRLQFGDLADYGLQQPENGPFYIKAIMGQSPTIDVGAMPKIKTGDIRIYPEISKVEGSKVVFANGKVDQFDAIIFATGYKSTVLNWLKHEDNLFNEDGMPGQKFPNHWRGEKGLYCVGFAQRGLAGISKDAQNVADDIRRML